MGQDNEAKAAAEAAAVEKVTNIEMKITNKGQPVSALFISNHDALAEVNERWNECKRLNSSADLARDDVGSYCPITFDGWMCWNATPAGSVAVNKCPHFVVGFDPHRTAFKQCHANGSWFAHPDTGKPWSNYSTCIDFEDLEWRKTISWVYMSGYSISLVAVLISIFILLHFRALHCTRNILHINLFVSFTINNLLWLIWYTTVVPEASVPHANGVWCQILYVLVHYFMLTNYFWMLCEGFYLHSLLAFAFILEEKLLKYVYILGWIVPVFIIASYATARIVANDNANCWIDESVYTSILVVPVVISICVNLVFLVSILRVLLLKIKTNTSQGQNRSELIKVFRAAFVLVPLLGLHYMISTYRPEGDEKYWVKMHDVLSAVSASYQGLCVACLFCFLNNEVHAQIRRKWYQLRDIQNNQIHSTMTGSTYAIERHASIAPIKICTSNRSIGGTVTHQNNEVYMNYPYTVVSSLDLDDELLAKQNLLLVSETATASPPKNAYRCANDDVVDTVKRGTNNYERDEYHYACTAPNSTATDDKLSYGGANGPPRPSSPSTSIELIEGAAAAYSTNANAATTTSTSNPTKGFNGNCRRSNNGVKVETAEDYV